MYICFFIHFISCSKRQKNSICRYVVMSLSIRFTLLFGAVPRVLFGGFRLLEVRMVRSRDCRNSRVTLRQFDIKIQRVICVIRRAILT